MGVVTVDDSRRRGGGDERGGMCERRYKILCVWMECMQEVCVSESESERGVLYQREGMYECV